MIISKYADRSSNGNIDEVLIIIGREAMQEGIDYLQNCIMRHSGRIPVASFKTCFTPNNLLKNYDELISQKKSCTDSIRSSLGSRCMKSLFCENDIGNSINIALEHYYLISNDILDNYVRTVPENDYTPLV